MRDSAVLRSDLTHATHCVSNAVLRMGVLEGGDEGVEDERKEVDKLADVVNEKVVQLDVEEQTIGSQIVKVKWWVWVILVSALFAVSSAATALKAINAPPLLKASWRLQATSLILFIGFSYQLYKLLTANDNNQTADYSPEIKQRYFTYKTFGIMGLSGTSLAVHFGSWVVSLNYTSLAHSLLFVTCHPILIVFGLLILRKPISKGEIIGSVVGFLGLVLTLLDSFFNPTDGSDKPGVFGDFLAFIGALAIIVYLYVGKNLRSWVSLYLYAFPVTFLAAVLLLIASLIGERDALTYGIFGWFSGKYILLIIYLAIGPGFVGHTGINAILKYIEPVVISVTLLIEPVIGSFIGYFFHQSGLPGLFTFLGGPVIIAGCTLVTIAAYKRTQTTTSKPGKATNELFEDTSTQKIPADDETRGSTNSLLTNDAPTNEVLLNENTAVRHQTTKYEKLQEEDVELDVIVSQDPIAAESENKKEN